jgi:hypothetical protein
MNDSKQIERAYEVIIYQQNDSSSSWGTREANEQNAIRVVKGWLGPEFDFAMSSEYDSPFEVVLSNKVVSTLFTLYGRKAMTPVLTAQLWQGTAIPTFNFTLELETDSNPITDIKTPVMNLLRMVTPSVGDNGLLKSPGPSVDDLLSTVGDAFGSSVDAVINQFFGSDKDSSNIGKTSNSSDDVVTSKEQSSSMVNRMIGLNGEASRLRNQISISIGRYLYFPSVVITDVQTSFKNIIEAATGFPMSATVEVSFKPLFMPTQEDLTTMFGQS